MSTGGQRGSEGVLTRFFADLRNIVRYRTDDLLTLGKYLIVMSAAVSYITFRWGQVWEYSLTKAILDGIAALLPVGPQPVYAFPLFVLLGLSALFLFDDYKRLQGVLLAVGVVALFLVGTAIGRLRFDWFARPVLVSMVLGFVVGLYGLGGLRGSYSASERNEFRRGFVRLGVLAIAIGLVMLIEQHLIVPLDGTILLRPGQAFRSAAAVVRLGLDLAAVVGLGVVFAAFTTYDLTNEVAILGPSRSGKTWFLAGLAYTFEGGDDSLPRKTELSDRMHELYNDYDNEDFDDIGPTDTSTARPMQLTTDVGGLVGGRLHIRSADYGGERLSDIDLDESVTDDLRERKRRFFEETDENGDDYAWEDLGPQANDPYGIGDLLHVLVEDADIVCLVLPLDAVLDPDAWDDEDFDPPLGPDDLRTAHDPPKTSPVAGEGYYDIYQAIRETRDSEGVLFLGTKADLLRKAFRKGLRLDDLDDGVPHGGDPPSNWQSFREYVWQFASEQHSTDDFRPSNNYDTAADLDRFFPVYFETEDERTDAGNVKPVQERGERNAIAESSPLLGLGQLLRRIR